MYNQDFSEPRRQAPLGLVIMLADNFRKGIRLIIFAVAGSLFSERITFSLWGAAAIAAVVLVVLSVLQFLRFKFYLKNEELVIERGVLQREVLNIPLERIQTVQLSQNLVQQVVGLTGLKIDTAGSGKEELSIKALTKSDAQTLRALLEKDKAEALQHLGENEDLEAGKERVEQPIPRQIGLVRLSIGQLMVVGLTENHIRNGMLAIFFVFGWLNQFNDMFVDSMTQQIEERSSQISSLFQSGLFLVAMFSIGFAVLSVLISIGRTVLTHFNLTAELIGDKLRVQSGLLKRNEFTVPLSKIQILDWKSNILRRIPGFKSVVIKQSKSQDQQRKLNIEVPACYAEQEQALQEALYSENWNEHMGSFKPDGFYRFYLFGIFALFTAIPFVIAFLNLGSWEIFAYYGAWLAILFLLVTKYYNSVRVEINAGFLQFSRGWLSDTRSVMELYKVQAVSKRQSIFQKRRGTAHLKIYTAGGVISLRFLDEQLVDQMQNFFLYKANTSQLSWM